MTPEKISRIFDINDQEGFQAITMEIFKYQSEKNQVYNDFIKKLDKNPGTISALSEIPFLPISFFKSHKIITGNFPAVKIFESSGTSGTSASKHYIVDNEIYEKSLLKTFTLFYGSPAEYFIAALLPSYLERENSSLVYMVDKLIKRSSCTLSGFFNNNVEELISRINKARSQNLKILLIGVSFALLDLAEKYCPDLSDVIIMETGGMKGRRKEITREELHLILKKGLNVKSIHSEYGMTELLSQAYSKENGIFYSPPWMKIFIRDPQDPLSIISEPGVTGGINIIDLANVHSCSFLATDDLGRFHNDGGFEVLGRLDNQDIRGCNLLID
jgi:phenylacetate-coenzyme A ligase PaaK-like adenylate-forming protein